MSRRPTTSQRIAALALGAMIGWGLGSAVDRASADHRACHAHPVRLSADDRLAGRTVTRAQCVRQYRRTLTAYPTRPTWREAMRRMSRTERAVMYRIGVCEMGTRSPGYRRPPTKGHPPAGSRWASLRWGLDLPRYSTAFGIWNGNGRYINAETRYSFPGATPAEEVLGATALARRYGFSAWACY